MSYEEDKAIYIAAAAAAASAAVILVNPLAKTIALMIGSMISDPAGMKKLADQWRDSKLGGESVDLGALKITIAELKAKAEAEGWKGEARKLFDSSSDTFLREMNKLANHRNSAGDTVDQTALIFHYGAGVAFLAASTMSVLATIALASTFVPALRVGVQIAITQTLRSIGTSLQAVMKMKLKGVFVAATILGIVNMYSASQAALFPGLEAVSDKVPDFGSAGFGYTSGTLSPSLDLGAAQQPKSGFLGIF
ncbi:hypothetical protein [Streptosporangium amethystogenes]|uniref:hypothetical protein n=1 Tax=Streptosporangium amethystogenes TaxID=2002 RepID=UPI000ADAD522|nr:hypothetical protein [Streptosporangium amethystogenes]